MKTALSIYIFGYLISLYIILYNLINEVFIKSKKQSKKLIITVTIDFFAMAFLSVFYGIFLLIAAILFLDFYCYDKFQNSVLNYKIPNTPLENDINKQLEELKILSERKEIQDLDFFYDTEFIAPSINNSHEIVIEEYKLFKPKAKND